MHTHITSPSTSSTTPTPPRAPRSAAEDADYHAFVKGVQASYDHIVKSGEPVFTTNAANLFKLFLDGLPTERQGHYNCQACRHFFRRFGGLVTITETGALLPVMWSRSSDTFEWPPFFRKAVLALHDTVTNATVTGVYLVTKNEWGISYTEDDKAPEGRWTHLHVKAHTYEPFKETPVLTAHQATANKVMQHKTVAYAIRSYGSEIVNQAVRYLRHDDGFARREKVLPQAEWFKGVHLLSVFKTDRNKTFKHLLWRQIATAPEGLTHIKSNMLGFLLDNIKVGTARDLLVHRFNAKMDGLEYQRPKAAPTNEAIEQAEKAFTKLGYGPSLERRFATLADVSPIWTPPSEADRKAMTPSPVPAPGLFGHLRTEARNATTPTTIPPKAITFRKLREEVLGKLPIVEIAMFVGRSLANFGGFVTAVHKDAPPIIQWDNPERRNPISTYVYHGGSMSEMWNLTSDMYHVVSAIVLAPHLRDDETTFARYGKNVMFVLHNAQDNNYLRGGRRGGGLFPEILRSEFHPYRKTIEAHVLSTSITRDETLGPVVAGLFFGDSKGISPVRLRVTLGDGTVLMYDVDRWD